MFERYLCCLQSLEHCAKKMELTRAMIYDFRCGLTGVRDNIFKRGRLGSLKKLTKVVRNDLLRQKTMMLTR